MSLLLKALKQAETAHAEKSVPPEPDLALEAIEPDPAKAREWLEPPGMVFGNSGLPPPKTRRLRMPQLSLVPATALLAAVIALGYGVYLYYELQPPAAVPLPSRPAPTAAAQTPPVSAAPAALPPVVASAAPAAPEPAPAPAQVPVIAEPSNSHTAPTPRAKPARASIPSSPAARTPQRAARAASEARPVEPYALQSGGVNGLLNSAYDAYQRGQLDDAQRLYAQAAARERSVDALLGLAAIAAIRNREEEAARLYREVLDREPGNAAAQAALLDLLGNTDRQATESRLKLLIERAPSAHLYQTLGNLYAEQGRWSDAQSAYYEAFRIAPSNADYAFNLAVSLDRLQQPQAALNYYEKALALGGNARFDRAQAEARIRQIKTSP